MNFSGFSEHCPKVCVLLLHLVHQFFSHVGWILFIGLLFLLPSLDPDLEPCDLGRMIEGVLFL